MYRTRNQRLEEPRVGIEPPEVDSALELPDWRLNSKASNGSQAATVANIQNFQTRETPYSLA